MNSTRVIGGRLADYGRAMPTKISDNGFSNDEAKSMSAAIKIEYKQLFLYLAELNEHAHQFLGKLKFRRDQLKQMLTIALLSRALTRSALTR